MHSKAILSTFTVALLTSTSVMAADAILPGSSVLPIIEEAPLFALTIEGGVTAFDIPDTDGVGYTDLEGPLFEGLDDALLGGTIGVEFSAPLNADGAALNGSAFYSYATRSGSESRAFTDERLIVLHGPSLPSGVIDLYTLDLDDQPVGTFVGDLGDASGTAIPGAAIGAVNAVAVIEPVADFADGADGFAFAGAVGDGQTFAFGTIASDEGTIFVGYGELLGWEVSNEVTQNLTYAGGDITFSQSTAPGDVVDFTAYIGPSLRYMGTETTTETSVTPNQYAYPDIEYATFSISTVENIDTYYGGVVFGGSVGFDLWGGSNLTLDLGAGAYYAISSYGSATDATLIGGDGNRNELASSSLDLDDVDGFAYTVKAGSTFSAPIGESLQLNFGLGAEYMSRVATSRFIGSDGVSNNDAGGTGDDIGGNDVVYNSDDAVGGTVLSFGDGWSYKATVGLTGQF